MLLSILFLSFIALTVRSNSDCLLACPKNSRCVLGKGCVPDNSTCTCPETPCAFPLKCDCSGGCKAKTCTTTKACSLLINKLDVCEKAVCQNGQCVSQRLPCANCNPRTGCPTVHHRTASIDSARTTATTTEGVKENWAPHAPSDEDWDHHHHSDSPDGWIIASIVILLIVFLTFIGSMFYLWWTARSTKK